MKAAVFLELIRGERGSAAEHLSAEEYKYQQEKKRVAALEKQAEKKEVRLAKLDEQITVKEKAKATIAEVDAMGHFTIEEQNNGLKKLFRKKENMSGILNWLMEGCRLMLETGMDTPTRVTAAVNAYREETDIIGSFLSEYTAAQEGGWLSTSLLYSYYAEWAKSNGYRLLSNRPFVGDLRLSQIAKKGNVIIGLVLSRGVNPY